MQAADPGARDKPGELSSATPVRDRETSASRRACTICDQIASCRSSDCDGFLYCRACWMNKHWSMGAGFNMDTHAVKSLFARPRSSNVSYSNPSAFSSFDGCLPTSGDNNGQYAETVKGARAEFDKLSGLQTHLLRDSNFRIEKGEETCTICVGNSARIRCHLCYPNDAMCTPCAWKEHKGPDGFFQK